MSRGVIVVVVVLALLRFEAALADEAQTQPVVRSYWSQPLALLTPFRNQLAGTGTAPAVVAVETAPAQPPTRLGRSLASDDGMAKVAAEDVDAAKATCLSHHGPDLCSCRQGCLLGKDLIGDDQLGDWNDKLKEGAECNDEFIAELSPDVTKEMAKEFDAAQIAQVACDAMKCNAFCHNYLCSDEMPLLYYECAEAKKHIDGCDVDCSRAASLRWGRLVSSPVVLLATAGVLGLRSLFRY